MLACDADEKITQALGRVYPYHPSIADSMLEHWPGGGSLLALLEVQVAAAAAAAAAAGDGDSRPATGQDPAAAPAPDELQTLLEEARLCDSLFHRFKLIVEQLRAAQQSDGSEEEGVGGGNGP